MRLEGRGALACPRSSAHATFSDHNTGWRMQSCFQRGCGPPGDPQTKLCSPREQHPADVASWAQIHPPSEHEAGVEPEGGFPPSVTEPRAGSQCSPSSICALSPTRGHLSEDRALAMHYTRLVFNFYYMTKLKLQKKKKKKNLTICF